MAELLTFDQLLAWRDIDPDDACKRCGGSGIVAYPNTATWRGGVGGNTMTNGPCDKCWGSGDNNRPWPSHGRTDPQEMVQLAEAVAFYADPENWHGVYMVGHGPMADDWSEVGHPQYPDGKPGKLAREAIEAWNEKHG